MLDGKPSGVESEADSRSDETVGLREPKGRLQLSVHETDHDLGEDWAEEAGDGKILHVKYALSDAEIGIRRGHFAGLITL